MYMGTVLQGNRKSRKVFEREALFITPRHKVTANSNLYDEAAL